MSRCRLLMAASTVLLAIELPALPAAAQLVVFDPSNFAQNVVTAASALQQISNQITMLQNQSQMLSNQSRNLANLPYSSLTLLQTSIQRTQALLGNAQNIAYDVGQINLAFQTTYGPANAGQSGQALTAAAQQRWQNSVGSLQDSMTVQAGVVGNLDTNRTQTAALVTSSQSATGALQATQAGNQLLALQAQQLADVTAVLAAQARAQSLESAQKAVAQDQAREQLSRFLTPGVGYQPTPITMFQP